MIASQTPSPLFRVLSKFVQRTFTTADGLRLAADVLPGRGAGPVVLLHGGGQTRHAWGQTAEILGAHGWETIAVDQRGHGESEWAPNGDYALDRYAADVREIILALDSPPVLVGASLGGVSSLLALATDPPPPAAALILVDIAHRHDPDGAQRVVDFMRENPSGFADPSEAVEAVRRYLPHRPAPRDTSGIERNLRRRDGRWHWHWDPAMLDGVRPLVVDRADELNERLARAAADLRIPTLLVRGAASDVLSESIAREFATLAPHARVVEVERAAHMVAGDENDRFTDAVLGFLSELRAA
jgi:pimeloyl-ACP methyl ester carboxylesterase